VTLGDWERLSPPRCDREDPVRVAEVPSRRRHDGPLGNNQLSSGLNGEPDIFLTDEIERRRV